MMKILPVLAVTFATIYSSCHTQARADYLVVQNNKPRSVIVAPSEPQPFIKKAIDELQYHLQRASGATLPVVDEKAATALPKETLRIVMNGGALPLETYAVQSAGNTLTFTGDGGKSNALLWAVDYYLDTQLGVRWLWPGEVGTYVPTRATIALPSIDYQGKPALEKRELRNPLAKRRSVDDSPTFLSQSEYQKLVQQSTDWLDRFQMGSRSSYKFGHSFTHWWDKYGKDHPEYFAVPPAGSSYKQPWPMPGRVKLKIGNPAIDDVIIAEWQAAGAPDNWNVCPNDSAGFDTSDVSRALDDPPHQDPHLIWRTAKANLTARYVKFWNRLIVKMRKINPNVTLSSYAYSAYRNPPLHGLKLQPGIVLGLVPSYWAQVHWQQWQQAGAQLYLRPNWWHSGGVAPVIPLHQQGDFFKFAQSHNMIGFDSDSLLGYWATQGPMYYTIARLSVQPQLSVDDVINEYCSAFGKAAPDIKNYLKYWEDFTAKAAYPAPAGGGVDPPHPGAVNALITKHGLSNSPLAHGWQVIPYLYTDDVLNNGYAILDQATRDAASDSDFVHHRIQFLRDGLDHLKLTRDVLQLGYLKKRTAEQEKQYRDLAAQLQKMRYPLTLKNVIWGEVENGTEKHRHAPTIPSKMPEKEEVLEGM